MNVQLALMEFGHLPLLGYRELKEKAYDSFAKDLSHGYRVLSVPEFKLPGKQDFLLYHPSLADIQPLNSTKDRMLISYQSSSFLLTTVLLARACLQSIDIYLSINSSHKSYVFPLQC